MTSKKMAEACFIMAKALGLNEANKMEFTAQLMSLCLFGDSPIETVSRVVEEERDEDEPPHRPIKPDTRVALKKRVSAIKRAAKESDREEKPRKLLCRANTKCYCSTCAKPLYTVLSDIYDGLKAEEFAAKFLPIGHAKTIPIPTRLRAIDGCVMTDCPVCGGDMTLILWGKKPERDFDDGGVSSTGGGN